MKKCMFSNTFSSFKHLVNGSKASSARLLSTKSTVSESCNSEDGSFKPLHGVKVLDLSRVLAGPYCTMILGDLGAEIIKIERPGAGDDTRTWGPPWMQTKSGEKSSAYFVSINRNKKSVAVDLKYEEGSQIVRKLASKCDVLVENYLPGKLAKMNLGYDQMKEIAPHLIYTSITGFGQTGPYSQRGGYDNIAAAIGGLMHITGPQDGAPCRVGVAMTDLSTGLYALSSIMAALLHRKQTGKGQHIDCNLLNTQVATLTHIASNYLNCGVDAKRWGAGHGSIVPYQTFKTMDGYLMIGAGNEKLFKDLCQRLEMDMLLDDERFSTNENRVNHRDVLIPLLADKFRTKSNSDWCDILEGSSVPFGPVNSMEKVFEDPQVLHNEMIQNVEHPALGDIRIPAPAVTYSDGPIGLQCPPPNLGQHTTAVLREQLGYSAKDIDNLKERNIIQC